ncbi:MAG: hypothetical protein WCD00_09145, partial [Desulfuromonadaceae bacterium]
FISSAQKGAQKPDGQTSILEWKRREAVCGNAAARLDEGGGTWGSVLPAKGREVVTKPFRRQRDPYIQWTTKAPEG